MRSILFWRARRRFYTRFFGIQAKRWRFKVLGVRFPDRRLPGKIHSRIVGLSELIHWWPIRYAGSCHRHVAQRCQQDKLPTNEDDIVLGDWNWLFCIDVIHNATGRRRWFIRSQFGSVPRSKFNSSYLASLAWIVCLNYFLIIGNSF